MIEKEYENLKRILDDLNAINNISVRELIDTISRQVDDLSNYSDRLRIDVILTELDMLKQRVKRIDDPEAELKPTDKQQKHIYKDGDWFYHEMELYQAHKVTNEAEHQVLHFGALVVDSSDVYPLTETTKRITDEVKSSFESIKSLSDERRLNSDGVRILFLEWWRKLLDVEPKAYHSENQKFEWFVTTLTLKIEGNEVAEMQGIPLFHTGV